MVKELINDVLRPIMVACLAVLVAHCNDGCKAVESPEAAEIKYTQELVDCALLKDTLKEVCECRKEVDQHWGVCDDPTKRLVSYCDKDCEAL